MTKVAVLGAGSWGTTFAKVLADGGADVAIWARRPELAREITEAKRNSDYLPGINLPRGLWATRQHPRGARGRRAGLPLGAEPVAAREPARSCATLVPQGRRSSCRS